MYSPNAGRVPHTFEFGEELPLLVDAVRDYAIFGLSPAGEIRSWNTGAARIMGYRSEEVLGRHFSIFYGPEDLSAGKPGFELEMAEREGRIEDEGWRLRKDGSRFWANTIITELRDEAGILRGFAKVTRDLTQRREAEERARQSEEVFRLLVAAVKDYAIFLLDPDGHIATWNAGAQAIKGYRPEEIIGQHFSVFYSDVDLRDGKPERELRIAKAEGAVEDEGWRLRKDGTRFWANVVITAVHDERGTLRGFAKVTRDITERKNTEEVQWALIEQKEARLVAESERRSAEAAFHAAQEANRAKDEFLMTLSHELRTPMTAILGWSRLLPTLSPTDPILPEALASISRSADLQAQLIDDVLDVSGIVSGKLRLNVVSVDVARVLGAAVEAVRHSSAAKDVGLVTDLAGSLGHMLADPTRLQQIVWNLLANAVKFTPAGGRVELRATRSDEHLQIVVSDNGKGIEASFLPRVFEPFLQEESPQTRVHGGLGLGLSIVRYLTEAQGGTVTVASEGTGQGATFTIRLPLREGDVPEPAELWGGPTAAHAAQWTDRLGGLSILLVDDDDDSRSLVATMFRRAGASVRAVDSVEAALQSVELATPDAVITDIAMPNADGYSLLKALRLRPELQQVPVVALSAFASNATPREAGFTAYLNKPIDPFRLIDEVALILKR